ncbi:MAG: SDR family NAD(P)-dependent oxidoreductase [Bacillota bacterium]|nr:SDR family NAD(P)-dependent oxidoreductase [Bacillota bacterium]
MHGEVAFVTGSSRGIGRAIALELARRGADVAINCRTSLEQAQTVCAEVERLGRRAVLVTGDTRVPEDVERMMATVPSTLGDVYILVKNAAYANNAAYALLKPFLEFTVEEWRSQLEHKALVFSFFTLGGI